MQSNEKEPRQDRSQLEPEQHKVLRGLEIVPAPDEFDWADSLTEEEEEELEQMRALGGRFRVTGPNLRAELTEMVREDPDSAAKVLSRWIGEVN